MIGAVLFFVSFLTAGGLFLRNAQACSVCFGQTQQSTQVGLRIAIIAMLLVLLGVLSGIVAFFFQLRKKSKLNNRGILTFAK